MPTQAYTCSRCNQPTSKPMRLGRPRLCSTCSMQPRKTSGRSNHTGPAAPYPTERVCPTCGASVIGRRANAVFCSRECKENKPVAVACVDCGDSFTTGRKSGATRCDGCKRQPRDLDLVAWERIIKADPCAYCGAMPSGVDHIDPRSFGGPETWDNLTACCHICNASKNARRLVTYLGMRPHLEQARAAHEAIDAWNTIDQTRRGGNFPDVL